MNSPTGNWTKASPAPKEPRARPIHDVRFGHVAAAIWRNENENGVWYNTTFSRTYRDGEQWKSAESFGRDDLLLLAKVANEAHSWIFSQNQEKEVPATRAPAAPSRFAKTDERQP